MYAWIIMGQEPDPVLLRGYAASIAMHVVGLAPKDGSIGTIIANALHCQPGIWRTGHKLNDRYAIALEQAVLGSVCGFKTLDEAQLARHLEERDLVPPADYIDDLVSPYRGMQR